MAKLKQDEESSSNQDFSINSDAGNDWNFLGEDWVIVKDQRVNILIPTLPRSSEPVGCNTTSEQLQDAVLRESDNTGSDHPSVEIGCEEQVAHYLKDNPSSAMSGRSCNPPNDSPQNSSGMKIDVLMEHKSTRTHHGLRTVKQWRLSLRKSNLNDGVLLNKMMKASNLERKLLNAGGLNRWLASVGLYQFIRIFHARKISKFQLVNLSMRKLKDMGIDAVGPRRKLMHAIECVCHPYCFEP